MAKAEGRKPIVIEKLKWHSMLISLFNHLHIRIVNWKSGHMALSKHKDETVPVSVYHKCGCIPVNTQQLGSEQNAMREILWLKMLF